MGAVKPNEWIIILLLAFSTLGNNEQSEVMKMIASPVVVRFDKVFQLCRAFNDKLAEVVIKTNEK